MLSNIRNTLKQKFDLKTMAKTIDELLGYSHIQIQSEKLNIHTKDLSTSRKNLLASKKQYEESIQTRKQTQKQIQSLLQRKDSWSDLDVVEFTRLYRLDLTLDQAELKDKMIYQDCFNDNENMNNVYIELLREKYTSETMYSDKIRKLGMWTSVLLVAVHSLIFVYGVFNEKKRRLLISDLIVTKVSQELQLVNGQVVEISNGVKRINEFNQQLLDPSSIQEEAEEMSIDVNQQKLKEYQTAAGVFIGLMSSLIVILISS